MRRLISLVLAIVCYAAQSQMSSVCADPVAKQIKVKVWYLRIITCKLEDGGDCNNVNVREAPIRPEDQFFMCNSFGAQALLSRSALLGQPRIATTCYFREEMQYVYVEK